MGDILLLLIVLQTIIATSLSVTLPFPNAIGKVTPIKPRPLPSATEVLPSIKSLEWEGEDIISPLFSSLGVSKEFSSPVALKTSSKPLPVPKLDDLSLSKVKLPEGCIDSLPTSIKKLLKGESVTERNSDVCSKDILFPFKRLKDPIKIPKLCENTLHVKRKCEDMSPSSSVSEVSMKANPFAPQENRFSLINMNNFVPNTMLVPHIRPPAPATLPIDALRKSAFASTVPQLANNGVSTVSSPLPNSITNPAICSTSTLSEPPKIKTTATHFSELPSPSLTPGYAAPSPYSLFYQSKFLPRVRTPEFSFRNCRPPFFPTGNPNVLNLPDSSNLISPTPSLPVHFNLCNERKSYPDLTCSPQPPIKSIFEPVPSCVNPITMTERPNLFNQIPVPKILPPLSMEPGFCPSRVDYPWQYKNLFTPSVCCENIRLPNSCTTLDTICTDNIYPILDSIPFVTVNDVSYSYPNGLPTVTPKGPCEGTLFFPPDVFCSNSPCQSTSTPYLKDNLPHIKSTPIVARDEKPNCKNFDSNIRSSEFSIPNMFPTVDAFVDSLNNLQRVNIPEVCTTSRNPDICSCTTSLPPVTPTNNCCAKIYTSAESSIPSYINISPSCPMSKFSSKMVASINDMVANITQNLLSSYISCLQEPKPVCKRPSPKPSPKYKPNIPEFRPQTIPVRSSLPPVNLSYEKSPAPIMCSPTKTNYLATNTNYCPQAECPIIIQLDSLFTTNPPSFVSPPDTSPFLSLINYSSSISPSYLPSPTLPIACTPSPTLPMTYPSSPFYPEPPIVKVSSGKCKKEKDRVLELMILSELLDGDDYEWDELDTLLALLALS